MVLSQNQRQKLNLPRCGLVAGSVNGGDWDCASFMEFAYG